MQAYIRINSTVTVINHIILNLYSEYSILVVFLETKLTNLTTEPTFLTQLGLGLGSLGR